MDNSVFWYYYGDSLTIENLFHAFSCFHALKKKPTSLSCVLWRQGSLKNFFHYFRIHSCYWPSWLIFFFAWQLFISVCLFFGWRYGSCFLSRHCEELCFHFVCIVCFFRNGGCIVVPATCATRLIYSIYSLCANLCADYCVVELLKGRGNIVTQRCAIGE